MDHFSKYHVIFPLKNKTAQDVAEKIQERVLSYLGVPKIFHSDNGREFVNELLHELLHALFDQWGSDVLFVRGRPRHSQSQGLIENGNKTLEKRLAAIKSEKKITGSMPWSTLFPRIQYGLNVTVQESIMRSCSDSNRSHHLCQVPVSTSSTRKKSRNSSPTSLFQLPESKRIQAPAMSQMDTSPSLNQSVIGQCQLQDDVVTKH